MCRFGITKPSFEMNTLLRKRQSLLPLCTGLALFALLFSATVALVPHDHLLAVLDSAECVIEHGPATQQAVEPHHQASPGVAPLARAGHEHDCVGCQFSRSRSALAASFQFTGPVLGLESRLLGESPTLELGAVSTRSARGPPQA